MSHGKRVGIGVGAVIHRLAPGLDGVMGVTQILMLRRRGVAGAGTWCVPGGRVDEDDVANWEDAIGRAAEREAAEEVGLRVRALPHGRKIISHMSDGEPWVCVMVPCEVLGPGEPVNMEPEKCAEMGWFRLTCLPSPLFVGGPEALTFPSH